MLPLSPSMVSWSNTCDTRPISLRMRISPPSLTAMLQRVQAEVRQVGDVLTRVEHPENTTLLVEVIVVEGVHSGLITHARSTLLRAPVARPRVTRRCTRSHRTS